jgi:glycosyltransferase involved in cell wall biosynthesis
LKNIGFLLNFPVEYKGGINYFKNLFYAIHKYHSEEVQIILFVPSDLANEYVDSFSPYTKLVKTKILQRKTLPWMVSKVGEKYFNFDPLVYSLLRKHRIDYISHSNYVYPFKDIKTINWIPDFQYLHYPHLSTKKQYHYTTSLHKRLIEKSDSIILSSKSALSDYMEVYAQFSEKVEVLNFVSQPTQGIKTSLLKTEKIDIYNRYNITKDFFYLPNQFWTHKNHISVFKAIKILKDQGYDPLLITSGHMKDFRNDNSHITNLRNMVESNGLTNNILFLGLIPYNDVINLMILAKCIINPSFFEGWSSTVEEARTMGKKMLLSNIDVHLEQNPPNAVYFDPNNELELAEKMKDILEENQQDEQFDLVYLQKSLDDRTQKFALEYLKILDK